MKYFITGGTGFIGDHLIHELLARGEEMVVLVRPSSKHKMYIKHPKLKHHFGDILDYKSLKKGMQGCDYVFHMAALASVWAPSEEIFDKLNIRGTENVLRAALSGGIKRTVFTSTAGVMSPSSDSSNEETPRKVSFFNPYERTKHEAELLVKEYINKGLDAVIVNPTRVFGPGKSESNAVKELIRRYVFGAWRLIPGDGKSIGNYVFVEDVVQGHLQALEKGVKGERYILGGYNLSFNEFFKNLSEVTGIRRKMMHVPLPLIMAYGYLQLFMANVLGIKPLITPQWATKYNYNWALSSEKARKELGYQITPFKVAVEKTIEGIESRE